MPLLFIVFLFFIYFPNLSLFPSLFDAPKVCLSKPLFFLSFFLDPFYNLSFFISLPPPNPVLSCLSLSLPHSCIPAPFSVYQTRQAHYDFISQTTLASPFSPCWGSAGSVLLYNFHNGTWKATYRAAGKITCSA